MIERHNGLLKSRQKSDINSMQRWSVCLWTVLWHLSEGPRKGALSPIDMLTHMAASPIQLQVQTKEESLKKQKFSHQNNILLPAPTAMNPRDSTEWTWLWTIRHMDQWWQALRTLGTRPGSWPLVYSWNNSWVDSKGHNSISWTARKSQHLTKEFCFIIMASACTSSSTIYRSFSNPHRERSESMIY